MSTWVGPTCTWASRGRGSELRGRENPCARGSDPRERELHVDVDRSRVDVRIHVRVDGTHVSVGFMS